MNVPPAPARRAIDLDVVVQALSEYRRTFFGFLFASVMAALIASVAARKQYSATAVIQLMPKAGKEMQTNEVVNNDAAGYMEGRDRARTQIQIILSRTIRVEVVERYTALGNTDVPNTPEGIEALGRAVSASPREDTQLVEISVLSPDPEHAALLANLFAEVYQQSNLDSRNDAARVTSSWLDKQQSSASTAVDDATQKAMAFKQQHDLQDIDEKGDGITSRLVALQTSLGEATSQRVLLESKLSEHRQLLRKGDYDQLSGMFADPALQTMAQQRATVISQSADVLAQYGDQHPEHQKAIGRIKSVEALIAQEVQRNVDGEASQVDTLLRQEHAITQELDSVKAELLDRQKLQTQYQELKLTEDNARRVYDALQSRGADVGLQANSQLNDVRLIDPALPPTKAATPNIPLNLAMSIAVGLGGGFALSMLRYRLNEAIMTTADIERYLDTPLVGTILTLPPGLKPADRALHSFNHPRSQSAEALRGIRGVLQTFPANGKTRRILVTSCVEGEGKTHSALGIAVTFAQLGQSVLLIDADLRVPQLHKLLGVPEAPGLSDALVDITDAQPFVVRTRVPRLFLLPRGLPVDYPNELLCSPELERLLARMGETFDIVIIDTPPAAVVADALSLARQVDGVILVIRRGRVARNLAVKTLGALRQMGARVYGIALNDVPRTRSSGSYYYDETARTDQRADP